MFYDVHGKEQILEGSSSIVNVMEVEMVLCVFRELVHLYPSVKETPSVAVISPYKAQVLPTAVSLASVSNQRMLSGCAVMHPAQ